jgi:hypothetical protein
MTRMGAQIKMAKRARKLEENREERLQRDYEKRRQKKH